MIAYGDIGWVFMYHPPTKDQPEKYEQIKAAGEKFAEVILTITPACGDQDAAVRYIRQAIMLANASIALEGRA